MSLPFKILLYYKYVSISHPQLLQQQQKDLCEKLQLKGRILLSSEGINGTIAGAEKEINEYIKQTESISEFKDIEWKVSWSQEQVFPRLRVVVRDEIVTLGFKKSGRDVSIANKARYIEPEELKELYDSNEDFVILDARNAYEATIGKFKHALVPPIDNFREFPEFVQKNLSQYKNKPIVTYCTGGVRCEKASAYLREIGFSDVRQLHGGVHVYAEKTGGQYFEGELFVFDKRLHIKVNTIDPIDLTACRFCSNKVTRYVDCVLPRCDELFTCCVACEKTHILVCSENCERELQQQASSVH